MKKSRFVNYLFLVAATCFLFSCGGSSKSESSTANDTIEVRPASTNITGKLGNMFTIEDKAYKIKRDGDMTSSYYITLSLKRTDAEPSVDLNDVTSIGSGDTKATYMGGFKLELLDADGDVITEKDFSDEDFTKLLSLAEGETANLKISMFEDRDKLSKAKTFRVSSVLQNNTNTRSDASTENTETGDSDLEDIDKDLDQVNKTMKAAGEAMKVAGEAAKALKDMSN